jgi:Nucleotidyl transferase AbiEii toxin, Type IV TA system
VPIDQLQREVATIALRVAGRHGFALAGGNALIAHGVIDRQTDDVDLFSDQEAGVLAAADAVEAALRDAGFQADRRDAAGELGELFDGMGEGLAEWIITAPSGQQTMLQMAYFDRIHGPVTMDVGPVLDLEDLAGSKVCALASRVEPRDYVDTAAVLARYSPSQLISFAKRLDPGLEDRDFADAGSQLDRMPNGMFERYGLSEQRVKDLRKQLAAWPRSSSRAGQPLPRSDGLRPHGDHRA